VYRILHNGRFWARLRKGGAFVLVIALLFNAVAPSIVAASQSSLTPQKTASGHIKHCDHMKHKTMEHDVMPTASSALANGHPDHSSSLECMSSVCYYQEASAPVALVASDAFLANDQLTERGSDLPSVLHATKDRPPQHI
jgi:hypothetical protein